MDMVNVYAWRLLVCTYFSLSLSLSLSLSVCVCVCVCVCVYLTCSRAENVPYLVSNWNPPSN